MKRLLRANQGGSGAGLLARNRTGHGRAWSTSTWAGARSRTKHASQGVGLLLESGKEISILLKTSFYLVTTLRE